MLVGTVGRLVAEKGLPELFAAMTRLPRDRFVLVVVGAPDPVKPDALGADEVARAREHGVRFLGHRDDVDALYAAMDVFVLASHREGFPRAAMEATAMGLPVVATDVRGCREVVDDGVTGIAGAGRRRRRPGGGAPGARRSRARDAPSAAPPAREPGSTSTSAGSSRSCWPRTDASPGRRASHSPVCEPESTTVAAIDPLDTLVAGREGTRSVVGPVTRIAGHRCGATVEPGTSGGVWGQW